jgi:hypothetical protein
MDIKRVAFETRAVASKRPAVAAQTAALPAQPVAVSRPDSASARSGGTPKVSREEIAAIVDRFLANRPPEPAPPLSAPPSNAPSASAAAANGGRVAAPTVGGPQSATDGHKAADFVSEDDVRRAIQKGEKIYVGAKTIITPSARDIGEPAEVFAKI